VTAVLYLAPQTAPPGAYHADKAIHLLVFFALGLPLWRAGLGPRGAATLVAVNAGLAFGLELAQSYVPGREFGLVDIAANLVGLAIGVVAGIWLDATLERPARRNVAAFADAAAARATRAK
jgi:VanZ family protein